VIRGAQKSGGYTIHAKLPDWAAEGASVAHHGHGHKDEFRKARRLTIPEQVAAEERRRMVPAPGAYDAAKPQNVLNIPKSTSPRGAVGDDAEYRSLQTPGHIYNTDAALKMTRPRCLAVKMTLNEKDKKVSPIRPPKATGAPDCGTYDQLGSYKKT